jgi:hypothetical protein
MQAFPQSPVPTWSYGVLAIAAVLALVALVVVLVVVVASNRSILSSRPAKAFGSFLLIGLPVLALFVFLSLFGLFIAGIAVPVVSRVERHLGPDGPVTFRQEISPDRSMQRVSSSPQVPDDGTVQIARTSADSSDAAARQETSVVVESPASGTAEVPAAGPTQSPQPRALETVEQAHLDDSVPLSGVLRARLPLVYEEPAWARQGPVPDDKGILVSLSSQRFATLDEAEQQVTRMAISYIATFYSSEHPARGQWNVPVSIIEQNAVKTVVGQQIEKDFGKMYLVHLRLNLNDQLRSSVKEAWRGQIVSQRLGMLGGGVALATLMLATMAGYFRLDSLTGGKYRGRLRLAALSAIGAAGSAALFAMGTVV